MRFSSFVVLIVVASIVNAESLYSNLQTPKCNSALPNSVIQPGYCPTVWASGLGNPRSLEIASNGDILTVESSNMQVTVLWDDNNNGMSDDNERAVLAINKGLNHAVRINGDYLYASNATHVLRWPYTAGDRQNLGDGTIVIYNIPCCHHVTRSLVFDEEGYLYVQVGSGSNVDSDTLHARINRFNVTSVPRGGIDWNSGYVYATGMRNEVGIRFDAAGNLWGVENGVDNEYREDLGGDIHLTNPCEELNLLQNDEGLFFGYPYCWSSYNVSTPTDYPPTTQFYQREFSDFISDSWCQDPANVVVPKLCMEPHMAPLDIFFWNSDMWDAVSNGDAFVAFHGSWNSYPDVGYRLDHVVFEEGVPIYNIPFLGYAGPGAYAPGWLRPVGIQQISHDGIPSLLLSSDGTGQIIMISQSE